MQHLITYAKDKSTGETRNIKDVVSGLACNCVCGNCGGDLEACKGKIRQHHFRHYSVAECKGAWESQLHLLSKDIVEEYKAIMLPRYTGRYCIVEPVQQNFSEVKKEVTQDDLQPDCLCKYLDNNGNEHVLWVEIYNKHAVDETKANKIRERHIECVEIDVSQLFTKCEVVDKELLIDFLLNNPSNRKWINFPRGDEYFLQEADKIRNTDIAKFLIENSDDETRIGNFMMLTFVLFDTGYRLGRKDYDDIYYFIKKHRSDIYSQEAHIKRRYVSAIQLLFCQLIVTGKYKVYKIPTESQLRAVCYDRIGLEQKLQVFINDVIRLGNR